MTSPFQQRNLSHRQIVSDYLDGLLAEKNTLHLPPVSQLRKRVRCMHFHPTPEVFLQQSGTNKFRCPDSAFDLQAGEAAIIHAGLPHGESGYADSNGPFHNIVICFGQSHLNVLESECRDGDSPEVRSGDTYQTASAELALGYINQITHQTSHPNRNSHLHINGLLRAFFALLLEILENAETYHKPYDLRVIRAQDLISSEISNPKLSVRFLSDRLNCSPDHFTRLFRQYADTTPNHYIRKQRIQYAITLLQDPSLNLSQIAWSTGFTSLNYFSRAFKDEMGYSASEYRKSRRGSQLT
ncbi:AraC family transcriptional regulator [Pelagicoccus mobilis]|uniref:Helix-turn-helix domain-containing protein n=1 Tax=Pelagicoccus mobilis TaxID=415221 RepID=A0A934S0I9_9BACT|nr:helix-turn-helix domain-containing protein [Pelagicoccus mobilis]MBK1876873.1 helix-turn-helix domain-containing protein [Pelagicoccus mobilis]